VSFKAAAWAVEQRLTQTAAQKLVLIVLADAHNGQTGRCDPSIQRVAELCHMSYRTVTRTLAQLEELALIQRINRTDDQNLKVRNLYKLSIGHGVPSIGHPRHSDRSSTTFPDGSQCPINQESINQEKNLGGAPTKGKSCFVPDGWTPCPVKQRMIPIPAGVDVKAELELFRIHEFAQPKSDWDRAWAAWLRRARPSKHPPDVRKLTVPEAESKHPALVAEREYERRNGTVRIGDL
jgi:hypothetical protein